MDVIIKRADGQTLSLSDYGIVARDFIVSSIPIIARYGTTDGRHGAIDYGATYGTRTISVPFYYKSEDLHDFAIKRDTLFAMIGGLQSFYISELRRDVYHTGDNITVNNRKFKVRLANEFAIEQTFRYGFGELVFETTELPFAETDIVTTKYTTNKFRLTYEGNVDIHPFQQRLKITISKLGDSADWFELVNRTNGDKFRIDDVFNASTIIEIDGPSVTVNGLNALRKTNRKFIRLASGWNDFEIIGLATAEVSFEYVNYYL